jgi:uncharacterized membrane protein YraQ (UPF0718 family)
MALLKSFVKRYIMFLIVTTGLVVLTIINRQTGIKAWNISAFQFEQMLFVIPPIFILLGLMDVWVPRETMVKYMGKGSGVTGIILAFVIGSAAAGPLYGAFPIASVFMKKGVKFTNLLIFIGAWSTTKIPMLLFEITSLGLRFALTRLAVDIPGIIVIAYTLAKLIPAAEVKKIYENAEKTEESTTPPQAAEGM